MNAQERYINISTACELSYVEAETNSWIQQMCSSPTKKLPERYNNSSLSVLALPEMPLQPTISAELELLSDEEKQEDCPLKNKVHDVEEQVTQGPLDNLLSCLMEKRTIPLKRSRSAELHRISERRRRERINKKLKILQDLVPQCKKKDKASILEDATNYIKTLKSQVETMMKLSQRDFTHQQMHTGLQFPTLAPYFLGLGIGMSLQAGMCGYDSGPYAPLFFPSPVARHSFSDSALAGLTCSVASEPTPRNCCCEKQPCLKGMQASIPPGIPDRKLYDNTSSNSSALEVCEL